MNKIKSLIQKLIFGEPKKGEKINLTYTINPKLKEERLNNLQDFNNWIYAIHTHNNKFQNSIR
jgi:hypothetical protein